MPLKRRDILRLTAATGAAWLSSPLAEALHRPQRILDTHIHLFDPRRPEGIAWPLSNDAIYRPALPDRYAKIAAPLGVRGAIVVEASPRAEDNDWVLRTAAANPMIVGYIGNLVPGAPSYEQRLDVLRSNPLFLGIRCGNLWDRDLAVDSRRPEFMGGLKRLAAEGLGLDSANPDPALIAALLRISERVPDLRIVIDHLPSLQLPPEGSVREDCVKHMHLLATNSNVFIKLSEIPVKIEDRVCLDLSYYQAYLDQIWETFGEERILFGSDWPNSDHLASYQDTLQLVRSYVAAKGEAAQQKFFWSNSIKAYQWKPRRTDQSQP